MINIKAACYKISINSHVLKFKKKRGHQTQLECSTLGGLRDLAISQGSINAFIVLCIFETKV